MPMPNRPRPWGPDKPPVGTLLDPSHPTAIYPGHRWTFAEGAGTVVRASGSPVVGSLLGGITWAPARGGVGLAFDGASGSVASLPRPTSVVATAPWSLAIRCRYPGPSLKNLFTLGDGTNGLGVGYYYTPSGGLLVTRAVGDNAHSTGLATSVDTAAWHDWLIGWDGVATNCRIWCDGSDLSAAATIPLVPAGGDALLLSADPSPSAMRVEYAYLLAAPPTAALARSIAAAPYDPLAPPRPRRLRSVGISPGAASLASSGPAAIAVVATEATGATGSISHQWERSVTSATTGFGPLTGATGLSATDSTVSGTNTYWYRMAYTDAGSGSVVRSAAVGPLQRYTGGAIGGGSGFRRLTFGGGF